MTLRGRPPLSDEEKKKRGTFQPSRSKPEVGDFSKLKRVKRPKISMTEKSQEIYDRICKFLINENFLSEIDLDLIVVLAMEYEELYDNMEIIKHGGRVDGTVDGPDKPSAYITMKNQNIRNILSITKELGITPPMRRKIGLADLKKEKKEDPTATLISKK